MKKKSSKLENTKLIGQIEWKTSGPFEVTHAVIRNDGSIAVDCDCGEPGKSYRYTLHLQKSHKAPDTYTGSFTAPVGVEGKVGCLKFDAESGVALLGEWTEMVKWSVGWRPFVLNIRSCWKSSVRRLANGKF